MMKKVIKWTAYILVLGGLLAYLVCALSAPEFTKHATDVVIGWLNTPVGIAGISTTIGGIISYVIVNFVIKNTKFGRKELDNNKKEFEDFKEDTINEMNKFTEIVNKNESNYKSFTSDCDNRITILSEQFTNLYDNTMKALKTIPNKKVQAMVNEYEAKFDTVKQEIIDKTVNKNAYVDAKIKELENNYKKFIEKMEIMLNEREETFNSQTEAE